MQSNGLKRKKDEEINPHQHETKKIVRNDNTAPPNDIIDTAWEHYRSYLDSGDEANNSDGGGGGPEIQPDIDELYEIIDLLEKYVHMHTSDTSLQFLNSSASCDEHIKSSILSFPNDIKSLLPVLLSMVYLHLGDHAISEGFAENDEKQEDRQQHQLMHVEDYLRKSLSYFPFNAAALSMLANYQRMNMSASLEDICCAYDIAAKNARFVRDKSIEMLAQEQDDDEGEEDAMLIKEWVELLLLDGIAGSEYLGEDDVEKENDEEDICDGDDDGGRVYVNKQDDNAQEEKDEFSMSTVEATSSFMAALLYSTLQQHNEALFHLSKFDLTHRVHPNVWLAGTTKKLLSSNEERYLPKDIPFEPMCFTGEEVLPDHLYNRLCHVFSPSAMYWKETNYQNRGYFSFYEDICEQNKPKNLIDDVIINYLLPLAQLAVPSEKIVGYEFWTHTRPLRANLGHQMHFDTDEALLAQEKKVTHPIVSSVLYLTGNQDESERMAGSTIIFNQSPSSSDIAAEAYISHAQDRKYTVFPGCCLHGVLPCPGSIEQSNKAGKEKSVERLTLLVGFWTRRVPDKMLERHLYGPCSQLPVPDEENSWVQEIMEGYENGNSHQDILPYRMDDVESNLLPLVSPAWEDISTNVKSHKGTKLQVPTALDHRFFVKDASSCFRESLFKNETF
jgi:hypothetical protein